MDNAKKRARYDLATSSVYKKIRQELQDITVERCLSIKQELLQGILATIQLIDGWEKEYLSAIREREERGE